MPTFNENLIRDNLDLVKAISIQVINSLGPHPKADFEDAYQNGCLGLLEAAEHYNAQEGASFRTYAAHRVRGSVIDGLRRNLKGIATRGMLADHRCLQSMPPELRKTRLSEIRAINPLRAEQHERQISMGGSFQSAHIAALIDRTPTSDIDTPEAIAIAQDWITTSYRNLNSLDQIILERHVVEGESLRVIGCELGLTESRICQRLKQIRKKFENVKSS